MKRENKYYVYEWIRLDTNEPFYVGKGHGQRCYKLTRDNNKHFNNIVKSIPVVVNILLNNLEEKEAYQYECYYIWYYRDIIGYNMCNIADGGEGGNLKPMCGKDNPMYGRTWWNEDTPIEKIKKWRDNISKNSIGMTGRKHTKESKLKMSKLRKGRKLTEEWKLHIKENASRWNLGNKLSEEQKKKISDNHADVSGSNNPRATKIYIYDLDMSLIHKEDTVIDASKWLVDNKYINTINGGRNAINRCNKKNIDYKGLYFEKVI